MAVWPNTINQNTSCDPLAEWGWSWTGDPLEESCQVMGNAWLTKLSNETSHVSSCLLRRYEHFLADLRSN